MRKAVSLLLTAAVAAGMLVGPASAGGKKTHGSFPAQALPFPKLAAVGDEAGIEATGCNAGEEGVHKVTFPFEAPANGILTSYMEGFVGDWDLFLIDADENEVVVSANDQATTAGATAAEEEVTLTMKKGQVIGIRACNWLGEPQTEVHYDFIAKK